MKNKKLASEVIWLQDPEEHDFPAAIDYLELIVTREKAEGYSKSLKEVATIKKKAKDILRASRLPLLPKDNIHVRKNIKKVKNGEKLSPVLLVRHDNLIIADGYHRVCAIYYLSEDLEIPCRLV
jgi:hypothetical protein